MITKSVTEFSQDFTGVTYKSHLFIFYFLVQSLGNSFHGNLTSLPSVGHECGVDAIRVIAAFPRSRILMKKYM